MPKINTASHWWVRFSNVSSGFSLNYVASLFLFLLFFLQKKTNEENVFLFTNVTHRKLAEKTDIFLKCESGPLPTLVLFREGILLAHRVAISAGVQLFKMYSQLHLLYLGACWRFGLSQKSPHSVSVVLPWSQSLLKSHRKHLLLVPMTFSHLCSLMEFCTYVSHDCEL